MKRSDGLGLNKHMVFIVSGILLIFTVYLIVQGIRCHAAVKEGAKRLAAYGAQTAELSYGSMTYVDSAIQNGLQNGDTILAVHGIFGGYDQAYDTCKDYAADHRIIAPSRFGYLGSDVLGEGTPSEQAAAYVELLDELGIDKVYPLATSAGGSAAIRFALDYPERTKGLILYCSAMPYSEKPEQYLQYAGPPAFLCNDYAMFLISPLFEPIMGMAPSTIYSMLPVSDRKAGVILDASVTNPDMARNFDAYPIESLQVPTLIINSKDDKLAKYEYIENVRNRFPDCTLVTFETGGHLMAGNGEAIRKAVSDFMSK